MRNGEDVNDYCPRVEKLYYKLCTVSTVNKLDNEEKIHETNIKRRNVSNIYKKT